jgi:hypothetical protein
MKTWLQQLERTAARWVGVVDHHTQPITTQILTGAVFTEGDSFPTPYAPPNTTLPPLPAAPQRATAPASPRLIKKLVQR